MDAGPVSQGALSDVTGATLNTPVANQPSTTGQPSLTQGAAGDQPSAGRSAGGKATPSLPRKSHMTQATATHLLVSSVYGSLFRSQLYEAGSHVAKVDHKTLREGNCTAGLTCSGTCGLDCL